MDDYVYCTKSMQKMLKRTIKITDWKACKVIIDTFTGEFIGFSYTDGRLRVNGIDNVFYVSSDFKVEII